MDLEHKKQPINISIKPQIGKLKYRQNNKSNPESTKPETLSPKPETFTNPQMQIDSLPRHEEVDFQPVSRKLLKKNLIQIGILCCAFLIGWGILVFWVQILFIRILSLSFIFCLFGYWFWNTFKLQKTYGFALREKDILYRRGYIVNKITVVPFNRIQHVSINRDIWDKKLNLSTLNIFTAGGSGSDIRIPGLEPEIALRLKDSLAKKVSED